MRGIVTVLNTPFLDTDQIDVGGLRKNVAYALDAGVAGFLVPALASEVHSLSEAERSQLVREVVAESAGRVPVIGGASASTQTERLRLAQVCIETGCDGVLVTVGVGEGSAVARDLRDLADLGPGFIMLQDWDPAGPGLPLETILQLFENVPEFTWLKIEVTPAGPKYTRVLDATDGKLYVAGGWAVTQMIDGLDRGVHAFMPTAMHRIYCTIYRRYVTGDRAGAEALFDRIRPVLAFSNQRLDVSIDFFKRLLHAQGIYATPRVRPPIDPFDDAQRRMADELIERVLALESGLKD